KGNIIGLDVTGTVDLGNTGIGIDIIGAHDNLIGGTLPNEGNLISGNGTGISIYTVSAKNNKIQGNLIGTDVTGANDLGNTLAGVSIQDASDNLVGGLVPEARNVISGNNHTGVRLADATSNVVQGNLIGTDITGLVALGNTSGGIEVSGVGNQIGGT